jgi:hypothetical protein
LVEQGWKSIGTGNVNVALRIGMPKYEVVLEVWVCEPRPIVLAH